MIQIEADTDGLEISLPPGKVIVLTWEEFKQFDRAFEIVKAVQETARFQKLHITLE